MKKSKGEKKKQSKRGNASSKQNIPIAYSSVSKANVPRITNVTNGCIVTHREMICGIVGHVNYALAATVAIQPGLEASFPWLNRMANNYESYKFRRLRYVYEPVCPTTTAGLLVMGADFDSGDASPVGEVDLAAKAGSVTGPVYQRFVMDCPVARMRALSGILLTRHQPVGVGRAIQTYDVGNCYVGTGGCAVDARMGSLFVEYTIELMTPGPPAAYSSYEDSAAVDVPVASGTTLAKPWGDAPVLSQGLDQPIASVESGTITFREAGEYLINYLGFGEGFTGGAPAFNVTKGEGKRGANFVNPTATKVSEDYWVKLVEPLGTFSMGLLDLGVALNNARTFITPIKYALNPY